MPTNQPDFMTSATVLAQTSEARDLFNSRSSSEAVEAYILKAQLMGVDPLFWQVPSPVPSYNSFGALPLVIGTFSCAKALTLLIDAGASPWAWAIKSGEMQWQHPSNLIRYALEPNDAASRQRVLKQAARTAMAAKNHGADVSDFVSFLVSHYDQLVKPSSKTAKGILGPADKTARAAAAALDSCADELRSLARELHHEADSLALERAILDAQERLIAKNDKAGAAVNTQKVKKSLNRQQRGRLSSLITLCKSHAEDEELIEAAFSVSDWLSSKPMAISLILGREGSLFSAALYGGSRSALLSLEKAGANIWLASAQHGNANPCLWAVDHLAQHPSLDLDVEPLARMMMVGAWLDGAPDPKARCVAVALEAHAEVIQRSGGADSLEAHRCHAIHAFIERQAIEELVAASGALAKPEAVAPSRPRSSL